VGLEQIPLNQIVEKSWGPLKGLAWDNVIKFLKVSNIDHRLGNSEEHAGSITGITR